MSLINDALKRARQTQAHRPPERPPLVPLQPVDTPPPKSQRFGAITWAAFAIVAVAAAAWFLSPHQPNPNPDTQTVSTPSPSPARTAPAATSTSPTPAISAPEAVPQSAVASATAHRSQPSPASVIKISTDIVTRPTISPRPTRLETQRSPAAAAQDIATLPSSPAPPSGIPSQRPAAPVTTPDQNLPSAAPPTTASSIIPPSKTTPPTPQPETGTVEFPPFRLQGIVFRMKRSTAIIDGQSVKVGDIIANVRVAKIERMSVTLEKQGQQKTFYLGQNETAR